MFNDLHQINVSSMSLIKLNWIKYWAIKHIILYLFPTSIGTHHSGKLHNPHGLEANKEDNSVKKALFQNNEQNNIPQYRTDLLAIAYRL